MSRIETIGDATLYLGDCREILPTLGKVDAVVTDPPYGIGYEAGTVPDSQEFAVLHGDNSEPDLSAVFALDCQKIIFGAENFYRQIPHRGRGLCWDKRGGIERADKMLGSPFELAWEDRKTGYYRMARLLHGGVVNADGGGIQREHPTQKPIELMKRCILALKNVITILDPYMGSGTTGVAAIKLGRQFIGIEIDQKYFDIACRRIQAAVDAPDMFIERAPEPKQESWNDMWKPNYHEQVRKTVKSK